MLAERKAPERLMVVTSYPQVALRRHVDPMSRRLPDRHAARPERKASGVRNRRGLALLAAVLSSALVVTGCARNTGAEHTSEADPTTHRSHSESLEQMPDHHPSHD